MPFTVTVRPPIVAPGLITKVAMAVPLGWTAMGPAAPSPAPPTEMPVPKLAVLTPAGKLVLIPVIVTWSVAPCAPVTGFNEKLGVPVIVNGREFALIYPVADALML